MLEVSSVSLLIWRLGVLFKENHSYSFFFSGEDALANLSIERTEAGTITGHVRIRSKTQGIALSLGDRITMGMSFFKWEVPNCKTDCFNFFSPKR